MLFPQDYYFSGWKVCQKIYICLYMYVCALNLVSLKSGSLVLDWGAI